MPRDSNDVCDVSGDGEDTFEGGVGTSDAMTFPFAVMMLLAKFENLLPSDRDAVRLIARLLTTAAAHQSRLSLVEVCTASFPYDGR